MPPVDPFVKAAVPGRRSGADRRHHHGYLTAWIPPPSPQQGELPPGPDGPASSGLLAGGSGPVDPELLAERGDVVADGGNEVRGVDGSGQLIPLDLGPDRVFSSAKTRLIQGVEVLVKVLHQVGGYGVDVGGRPLSTSVQAWPSRRSRPQPTDAEPADGERMAGQ